MRVIEVPPWAALAGVIIGGALMAWYLVATLYFVFRDEMLGRLMAQQADMQYAYEDRLAALRNQIDRITSRQVVDQDSLEAKLRELATRQAQLETRQSVVASLAGHPSLAGARTPPAPRAGSAIQHSAPVPEDVTGAIGRARSFAPADTRPRPDAEPFELRSLRSGALERLRAGNSSMDGPALPPAALAVAVVEMQQVNDRLALSQTQALATFERRARAQSDRLRAVIAETGIDSGRFPRPRDPSRGNSAQGGPLVPVGTQREPASFDAHVARLRGALSEIDHVSRIVTALPVARPMAEDVSISSSFGHRTDPFTRALAMHTGIDFRAPTGAPVRATGGGKVIHAGWMGGYGNMVEIDHGAGLITRYAHLSGIDVDENTTVAKGAIIGRVGSTGRSTGPHLHYETRIDDEPVDPMRFLRAGNLLGPR
jgi:murein DD-endopeptidase MepM/ murein hydrolase activator NlpD